MRRKWLIMISFIVAAIAGYMVLYYPNQQLPIDQIRQVEVLTPDTDRYMNDCLHPCIRYSEQGFAGYHYWMVQSPYYAENNRIENPILYHANHLDSIGIAHEGVVVAETPEYGYNSDPNLYIANDTLYVFWRECGTPLCDSLGVVNATVGMWTIDGVTFGPKLVYLTNSSGDYDVEQAPVLMRIGDKYRFYTAWYEYAPVRHNRGIAIWEGTGLLQPDFRLTDTVMLHAPWVCDKCAEIRLGGHHIYMPQPLRFDLWHFDLYESGGLLNMVAGSEKGDVVMHAVSSDGIHFQYDHKPLVSNHFMENYCHYRQYYYKPSAIVDAEGLHVFYTTQSDRNYLQNTLYMASCFIK